MIAQLQPIRSSVPLLQPANASIPALSPVHHSSPSDVSTLLLDDFPCKSCFYHSTSALSAPSSVHTIPDDFPASKGDSNSSNGNDISQDMPSESMPLPWKANIG